MVDVIPLRWNTQQLFWVRQDRVSISKGVHKGKSPFHMQHGGERVGRCKVFESPAIRRAKEATKKAQCFQKRPQLWIRRTCVEKLLEWSESHAAYKSNATLFLVAYAFLLRLPSEALPLVVGNVAGKPCIFREGEKLVVSLPRR